MNFAATVTRQTNKPFGASMSLFTAIFVSSHTHITALTASLAAFSATLYKQIQIPISAATVTFAGALVRGRQWAAGMAAWGGALVKETKIPIAAALPAMSGSFAPLHAAFQTLTAGLSAFAAGLVKRIGKVFNAS